MRIWLLFLTLALLFAVPFLLFGDAFEAWLAGDGAKKWLESFGAWAWAVAVALLVGDLVLPVPATAVMAGLARMQASRFFVALACGSLPMALVFAALGHAGAENPVLALAASAIIPLVLWGLIRRTSGRAESGK